MPNLAIEQIDDLDTLIYNEQSDESNKTPEDIKQFMESELVKRAIEDNERITQYMKNTEDFSRDWELYDKSGNTFIYMKPIFEESDLTSFTFGGESTINANMLNAC